jgi:hypothetical protein
MNVYYHLFCGDYPDATKVLRQVYQFAVAQPAHALTVVQYADIVRDSRETTIIKKSDNHWILLNQGKLRTFRVPDKGLFPDMFESTGVTGFNFETNVIYIHTGGSPKVELVLSANPKRHPYLISSSAEINFQKLTPDEVAFSVADLRPITVTLGGLPTKAKLKISVNQASRPAQSDAEGRIRLALPTSAKVVLSDVLSAR